MSEMFDFKNYQWRKMANNGKKWRWRICLFHLSNSPFRHWPPPPPGKIQEKSDQTFTTVAGYKWSQKIAIFGKVEEKGLT